MAATWQRLGDAVGCVAIGANRVRIDPGRLSTPPHSHGASEELVFVLGGSGLSWQDEQVYELRPGDCIVHLADHEEHTLRGGPAGLEVLICGTRHPTELGWLPRSRAIRLGWPWVEGRTDDPWDVEAGLEPLEFGEPAPRPKNIVNVDEAEPLSLAKDDSAVEIRYLAREGGAERTGMRQYVIPSGKLDGEPHCHGAETEFFLVLEGEGAVLLGEEEILLRPGSFVGRPPGTGVAHAFRGPLTLLTYGTNEPNEVCYYPRSKLLKFWGVDAQITAEPLARYWDDPVS